MDDQAERLEAAEESEASFSVDQALSVVRRHWLLIALAPVVVGAISAATTWSMPNRYDASATVQIDPRTRAISNVEGVVSDIKADFTTIESEVELVRSKPNALKTIEVLNLRADSEIAGTGDSILGKLLPSLRSAPPKDGVEEVREPPSESTASREILERDVVLKSFLDRLKVSRVRTTLLIEIKFTSADPVKAARIANTIAEVYLKEQIEAKMRAAGIAASLLEDKLQGMRAKVADAERKVEQFKAEHAIFDAEGAILSEKQLARLMEQTVQARRATSEAKAKFDLAQRLAQRGEGRSAIAEVLQSQSIKTLKDEVSRISRREAELSTKYGAKHPEMLKTRAELADAEAQLNSEVDRVVASLRNEYEVAADRERSLTRDLDELKQSQVGSKEASVILRELQREAATSKQLFESLLARYKQTTETQDLQLPDARIVERADVPLRPSGPKRKLIVMGATAGGLVLGLGIALLLELAAPGIARPEQAERVLDVEHLASLPAYAEGGGIGADLRNARMMLVEPRGMFAEAVRGLRREVDVRRQRNAPGLILIASSLPGEGKTAVASNLAHNYALSGVRTLLIDGDLRKARLTRTLLPTPPPSSLRDVLERGIDVELALLRDNATGLCCLPAVGSEPATGQASELLASARLSDALARLKQHFDVIILDSAPLLPVIDTRILADHADQIVFVMSWRKTPKTIAKRALKCLGRNEHKIVGFVLNQVDPAEMRESAVYAEAPLSPNDLRRAA